MSDHRFTEDGNLDDRSDAERELAEEENDTADEYYKDSDDE